MKLNNILSQLPGATVIFICSLVPVTGECRTADLAREQRLAEQIVDAIFDGEPVYLSAGEHRFLSIHTPSESQPARGAVIILHGRGTHPDWEQVAHPLRTGLPAYGWDTLSLQMPVLEKTAKYYDYLPLLKEAAPRIDAGINLLREMGHRHIVLIAHSCGVHMSMAWIRENGDADIDAYIGIGMGATDYQQPMKSPFPLERIHVPFLHVYGGADYPAVQRLASEMEGHLDTLHPVSGQIRVDGANHFFDGRGDELTEDIANWLNKLTLTP